MKINNKLLGYILLAIGLIMIFFSIIVMYNVFTGTSSPPQLFDFHDISFSFPLSENGMGTVEIISGQDLNQIMALSFWSLLMLFITFAGGKISSLGIDLITIEGKQKFDSLQKNN